MLPAHPAPGADDWQAACRHLEQLTGLLREARGHVAATRDRTNRREAYEQAVDLLARIDAVIPN